MPGLGEKYPVEIDVTSKPKADYETDGYFALDLPLATAVMVGDDIVVEGSDISDNELEICICKKLGLPEPQKTGSIDRLFGKS